MNRQLRHQNSERDWTGKGSTESKRWKKKLKNMYRYMRLLKTTENAPQVGRQRKLEDRVGTCKRSYIMKLCEYVYMAAKEVININFVRTTATADLIQNH